MKKYTKYVCSICKSEYDTDSIMYLCPKCSNENEIPGSTLHGVLETSFNRDCVLNVDMLCPIDRNYFPELPVGNTPFFKSNRFGQYFGLENLYIKNDSLNPSCSLKDRASMLVVAQSNVFGINNIVTASTGNAASALATMCASAGKHAIIFVPNSTPKPKLVQISKCGAELILVDGTYDDAFIQSLEYTRVNRNTLNRNTAYNPMTIEGKKSAGIEIFKQNKNNAPDVIIVPVGDGVIIYAIYKAFLDLMITGFSKKMPKIIGAQSSGSRAIYDYIHTGQYEGYKGAKSIADSITVEHPSNAHLARKAILESNGTCILVTDEEILEAQSILAIQTGIFAEPSSSSTVACLNKLIQSEQNIFESNSQIVLLITGHGLKNV